MTRLAPDDAVIVSALRSPIGRAHKGSMTEVRPDELAAQVVGAALARVPELNPAHLDDLMMGCGQPAGKSGFNIGRVVSVLLGLDELPATTVHRYCASSLQTTRMAFHAIKAGEGHAFVSAGVETVSQAAHGTADAWPTTKNPRFDDAVIRTSQRISGHVSWTDPRRDGVLPDVYIGMGQTAENVAQHLGISRTEQDQWAVLSQNRAEDAIDTDFFADEIVPITAPNGEIIDSDDSPRKGTTIAKLGQLPSAFRTNGTVTAGNSCPLNDGAAALIVVSGAKARQLGLTPLARVLSTGVSGLSPEIMGLGPIEASRSALKHAGMTMADMDLVEINEAFASQVVGCQRELGVDPDKLNVNGGAIALGHPFGMTGARITCTLLNGLRKSDQQFGLETMCTAGGQGMAMVLERLS